MKPILRKAYIVFIFFLTSSLYTYAGHLIGGEFTYRCLGNNDYEINLTIYRNCLCEIGDNCAPYDDEALITVYDGQGNFLRTFFLAMDIDLEKENVPPITEGLCLNSIPEVCVERSTGYSDVTNLPPIPGGYTLTYMRCCRNPTIINIVNPSQSALAECNSSPVFNEYPPIIICAGFPFKFDHSATDEDGDSLLYELCTPFDYPLTPDQPRIPSDEFGPEPPYDPVVWTGEFNEINQIGGDPIMTIDSATGLLRGFPNRTGQFVVGICVSEFRNGNLLSTSIRDFQFNIEECDVAVANIDSDDIDANGSFILNECGDFTVKFINESVGSDVYFWDLGDPTPGVEDTSTDFEPVYEYPDTGRYEITLIAGRSSDELCSDTATIILNLYPKLVPDFEYESQCSILPVEFEDISTSDYGTVRAWSWEFGDGGLSNNQNPTHLYEEGGNYEVFLSVSTDLGCLETVRKEIYVKPTPVSAYENSMLCLDAQPVQFEDASDVNIGNITGWNWIMYNEDSTQVFTYDVQSPTHTFPAAGDYNVFLEVTGDEGCKAEIIRPITIYETLTPDAGLDEDICENESVQLIVTANVPASFEWLPKDPTIIDDPTIENPTVSPNSTTTFSVLATDPNGCEGNTEVTVNVQPAPFVDAGEDGFLCMDDSYQLNGIGIDASGNTNTIEYIWSPGQFISNANIANPVVTPPDDMTYFLTVTENVFGCNNIDSINLMVVQPIEAMVNEDLITCELEAVQLEASGGTFYEWTPETGLNNPNIANPIATVQETITYQVEVSNECYRDVASVTIEVQPAPNVDAGPDFEIDIGDVITFNGVVEQTATSFNWSPIAGFIDAPEVLQPMVQPVRNGTYILTARSDNGCSLSDSLRVTVNNIFHIWVPSAFTPNDDNKNDEIGLTTKGIRDLGVFRIYNRWGQKVFETNDINATWDGFFNGFAQEIGVYVYYAIGFTYLDEELLVKGNITLLR